ncbi:DUF1810 domain-containing protein [Thiomicrorhabdus sp. ZW0627]|uniref:DUF1810 domain-containing protein n=1 Tax=Thiomicrorhabdus sp. ZW0627 TaxID=3039774 RepID=UPI0024370700|nr:DUF1810 domain-containing protein [Thiomicrorhabdus sp. ZW0627]MDG6773078.1 DUF1810 domain-containing protein [Thiomicrorhabdus sp. ZW0627]
MPQEYNFELERFIKAQQDTYETALTELQAGRKRTHWMWFIFPQLEGLGRTETAIFYGIKSVDEAKAYLNDSVLGQRLIECTEAVMAVEGSTLFEIFGKPDNRKFCSCMTLFSEVSETAERKAFFDAAIEKYCEQRDERTLAILNDS